MLKELKLINLGPAATMELEFSPRLNLFTGDNGLGKSFLLDTIWSSMTGNWPAEVNPRLTSSRMALPNDKKLDATIQLTAATTDGEQTEMRQFDHNTQSWSGLQDHISTSGIIIYAMSDDCFAVWDSERNHWGNPKKAVDQPDACVFTAKEVWDGLQTQDGNWLCSGIIRDWADWQKENGPAFQNLAAILRRLSQNTDEQLEPGALTRISLTDARDMPTIKVRYGLEVPIPRASAGIRRIITLAYLLVWCWEEHLKTIKLKGVEPEAQVTFLFDDVESHLHPHWQRTLVPALLEVMQPLAEDAKVQLFATTHSPLVMASIEPVFKAEQDSWFHLDLKNNAVVLLQRTFIPQGDATRWLTSDSFGLETTRALFNEQLIQKAANLLDSDKATKTQLDDMEQQLNQALNPTDSFLFNWRYIRKSKEQT